MNINNIIIVLGEPQSIFVEILFKYFKSKKFKNFNKKITLIGSKDLINYQMNKFKYKFNLNIINEINFAKKKVINLIDVKYVKKFKFDNISSNSNNYIKNCFFIAFNILKKNKQIALFNGPISKKHFLKKKYLGMSEYIAKKFKIKDEVMLIYNNNISVSPISTHLSIKDVPKKINKKKIINNILKINNFYKYNFNKRPMIAVLGLNPHCETIHNFSEEKKEIIPAIKYLNKKKIKIHGPFSADTFFLNKNIKFFDVVIGMYHDQVLTPLKTLYNFDAVNLTIGLPFIRISPDHGPNEKMIGKNISDPTSIFCAMNLFNKLK